MTALQQYERLEALGLWRADAEAKRREVVVSFGDATLVIVDPRAERPLAHWSLAAVERRNPGKMPAVFAPSPDPGEDIEIDDETMVTAINKVQHALAARQPHPGRLRGWLTGGALAAVVIVAATWLPPAIIEQAARIASAATRADIGRAILADMARTTGSPCHSTGGDAALLALSDRLPGSAQIVVVRRTRETGIALPGNIIVVGREAVTTVQNTPDVIAGVVIATELNERGTNPMLPFLKWAGYGTALKILTGMELPKTVARDYGKVLLDAPITRPDTQALITAFSQAAISATPYAYSVDPTGKTVADLINGDPYAASKIARPVLDEQRWIALQDICN